MGRERRRTRQYLYLCAAGLIITMLTACAPLGVTPVEQNDHHLRRGQQLLDQGDFAGALRENQEVLARFPRTPPGDEALFNMGLIYVDHANPQRDVGRTLHFFARLETEFPESPRTQEARTWGRILQSLEKSRSENIEPVECEGVLPAVQEKVHLQFGRRFLAQGDFAGALRENREVLARFPKQSPGDAALFNMGLIHVHYANPKKDIGQALHFFGRIEKQFPESPYREEAGIWIGILETMEKTRQIDIEIEEKKRELRR